MPATPLVLLDSAPMIPETRVPCHELFERLRSQRTVAGIGCVGIASVCHRSQ